MKKIIIWLYNFIKMLGRDNIFVYSAQASFFIIISLLPAAMLLLSLLRFFLPLSEMEILQISRTFTPPILLPVLQAIFKEIFEKTSPGLVSGAVLSSVWTASRGVLAIERGVRGAYETTPHRGFIKNVVFSIIYTIIFILLFCAILIFFIFSSAIIGFWKWEALLFVFKSPLKWFVFLIVFSLIFSVIYYAFSGGKSKFYMHLAGAVFTSCGWLIFSVLYSFYIENFANYSYVYGSLTAIILLMLWVYFCMIIFLTGAELNKIITKKRTYPIDTS